jgi:hypothetical protein
MKAATYNVSYILSANGPTRADQGRDGPSSSLGNPLSSRLGSNQPSRPSGIRGKGPVRSFACLGMNRTDITAYSIIEPSRYMAETRFGSI